MAADGLSRRGLLAAGAAAAASASVAAPVAFGCSPVALAIARHKAAAAAVDAAPRDNDLPEHLIDAEDAALEMLALAPCVDDAEFFDKLRYMLANHRRLYGQTWFGECARELHTAIAEHLEAGAGE